MVSGVRGELFLFMFASIHVCFYSLPSVQGAIAAMKSAAFISFLERLTGITSLLIDESNDGSGVHQIASGGSLKILTP